MNAIKRHPIFTAWIVFCAILLISGSGWSFHLRHRVRHEQAAWAQKSRLRDQLLQQSRLPVADAETVALSALPVAVVAPPPPEDVPRNALEAFIEIAGAKKTLRQSAARHEVGLRADESFGFGAYAREGPHGNELAPVHRQLVLVGLVLEKLFAAQPEKLISVHREQPGAAGSDGPSDAAGDFFRPDSRREIRVAGMIESRSVRLQFTGPTRVLRTFLNSLAVAPDVLVARSIEVEPSGQGAKFSVVVEKIEPVASATVAVAADYPELPEQWSAPGSAATGGDELFTARRIAECTPEAAVRSGEAELWELLAVKRAPYRLQLVGYFGAPGDYTGTFVSPGSPEIFHARVGHRFKSLGLIVKKVGVEKYPGPSGDEVTPTAELWDERNQEAVVLVGRERRLTEAPLAILRLAPPPAKPAELRTGDTFQDGPALCAIERIQLDPAEVVITRQSPGQPAPERRVLQLGPRAMAPPIADLAVERRK